MTLLEIKTAAASYLDRTLTELNVNGQDLGLIALNTVRRRAELAWDFEFTRKLATVSVDGVTGGSLDAAVLYGTATPVEIKTIIEVGLFDDFGNLRPVEWTTVSESLERQRIENMRDVPRYPTDAWAETYPAGLGRFAFTGSTVYRFPKDSTATFLLGMEIYAATADWTGPQLNSVIAPWTTHGSPFLLWATVVELNQLFKHFVFRQEGNLPPPQAQADAGLEAFKQWDTFRFEQSRRHGR